MDPQPNPNTTCPLLLVGQLLSSSRDRFARLILLFESFWIALSYSFPMGRVIPWWSSASSGTSRLRRGSGASWDRRAIRRSISRWRYSDLHQQPAGDIRTFISTGRRFRGEPAGSPMDRIQWGSVLVAPAPRGSALGGTCDWQRPAGREPPGAELGRLANWAVVWRKWYCKFVV